MNNINNLISCNVEDKDVKCWLCNEKIYSTYYTRILQKRIGPKSINGLRRNNGNTFGKGTSWKNARGTISNYLLAYVCVWPWIFEQRPG